DQRLHNENGIVRTVAVEPLINLLLDDETPWSAGTHVQSLIRDWLRALIIADTSGGYPLRVRLRERLLGTCAAGDRRLKEEREAEAAARAARSLEEIKEERRYMESRRALFTEV